MQEIVINPATLHLRNHVKFATTSRKEGLEKKYVGFGRYLLVRITICPK